MRKLLLASVFSVFAVPAAAQVDVGYPPPSSPYRDLEFKQEATAFGGYYIAGKDPAGIAPGNGPMAGIRYEVVVGGPAEIAFRAARVSSERRVIDPSKPLASRELGTQSWPVYLADLGLSLNLTGQRSYHGIVPVIYTGIGIATDAGKKVDLDPYRLGATFAFSLAGGLRLVPGGRFQMRADAGTYIYQIKYPTPYYTPTSDNTSVLASSQAKNFWKRNLGLTLGASYLLFR